MAQVGSIVIYTTVFFILRRRLAVVIIKRNSAAQSMSHNPDFIRSAATTMTNATVMTAPTADPFEASRQRIARTARYMVVYPFAYVALTLPLAAGRVSAMMGRNPPLAYYPVVGTLIASCGVIDVILYISTRKGLVKSSVGMKSSRFVDCGLARFRSADSKKGDTRDVIRMEGLRVGVYTGKRGSSKRLPRDAILVSKSITRREDSFVTHVEHTTGFGRPDSQQDLVQKQFEGDYKSWLA